jgi:eukaryotic-like serine/threonine-protein kinase
MQMSKLTHVGKYQIRSELGVGGMGVVYKAWDPIIQREVAIKAVKKSQFADHELLDLLNRFRQEARVVGKLVHPRIIQIYDYIEDEQGAYLVMELATGQTLADVLTQKEPLNLKQIEWVLLQVLDGLDYAHTHGVIHRDMKPGNVFLCLGGRIKIGDFGIARIENSMITNDGEVLGTPYYMAPEQFSDHKLDGRCDLFAVGVFLYEWLTGVRPFTGSVMVVMQQVIHHHPAKPSQINPLLSPEIDQLLAKALAKDPDQRYQNAREFAAALQEALRITQAPALMDTEDFSDSLSLRTLHALNLGDAPSSESLPSIKPNASFMAADADQTIHVLAVDDDPQVLTAIKSVLRKQYDVFTTTDPHQALELLKRHTMHVIISDQRMPIMQGVEFLARTRAITPHSVRILLTGYADLAAIAGAINQAEIYRYLNKPWEELSLLKVVADAASIALAHHLRPAPVLALPIQTSSAVLVVSPRDDVYLAVRQLLHATCPVLHATQIEGIEARLLNPEVAVVVTDMQAGQEDAIGWLSQLKQQHPEIASIAITRASDSQALVTLINQAQVFRLLHHPINLRVLDAYLHEALQHHLNQDTPAPEADPSSMAARLLRNLMQLGK